MGIFVNSRRLLFGVNQAQLQAINGHFKGLTKVTDKSSRIDPRAIFQDFEMNMRCGCSARAAQFGDDLSGGHVIADCDHQFIAVSIAGPITVSMVDFHDFSIAILTAGPDDNTTGNAQNFSAPNPGKIQTAVIFAFPGKWIISLSETR